MKMTYPHFAVSAAGTLSAALLAAAVTTVERAAAAGLPAVRMSADNPMPECATPGRMMAYLYARNPGLDQRHAGIASHYMRLGQELQVRWDYAFFQMIVETGSLTFQRGDGRPGTVKAAQYNFAGLGAVGHGEAGESFADVATGVKAHLQHLLMYAGERVQTPVAERTRKVQEWGELTAWHKTFRQPIGFADVTRKWAADPGYAATIEAVGRRFYDGYCVESPTSVPVAASPEATVSGADIARAAVERARTEGDGARTGLGMAAVPDAAPMPQMSPPLAALARPDADLASPPVIARASPSPAPRDASAVAAAPAKPAAGAAVAIATPPAKPVAPGPQVNPADEAVRSLVSGKTFVLDAAMGTTIPIVFRENGSMRGSAGSLAAFLGSAIDEGRWWVARGRLCQRWNLWLDRETQCLQLRQTGTVIHWVRDDGKSGTARIASR